ncbi:MAG TPA: phospholipase D-like domain-containing protein [Roseiarcus sp.]|nr:phospholipase D-like domain-containing protein [Roseiarcus sp.]
MKAVAFANNDIAVVAWTFGGKISGCLGFAIYRIDIRAGTETCLPAMATFPDQDATKPGRTTADDPIQKFFWKDVYARRGGTYRYRIVPMGGTPGALQPMTYGPAISNTIQLSPHCGTLSVYFNRGILATQATAHKLDEDGGKTVATLEEHIDKIGDPLRDDLMGELIEALTTLSDEAASDGGDTYCALYEFQDPEAIEHLKKPGGRAHVVLSNMPGGKGEEKTKDTYADERAEIRQAGAEVIDRFMPSGHIGHNKFQVLVDNGPQAVLFGSTNWTSHALCAQTNNAVVARSPALAAAYLDYWNRLKDDTDPPGEGGKAQQSSDFREENAKALAPIPLEDGSGEVDLWFSPNTPHARTSKPGKNEETPPDLAEVFDIIAKARQAVVFLAFEPGRPSIIDAVADAQKANPSLFVRGVVTASNAAGDFKTAISSDGDAPPHAHHKDDPPEIEDFRVIHTRGVAKNDAFGQWEAELNQAGHAVIHDKIVVVDPFSDTCVVVTGSHNLGYRASYNNDENLAIIRNHRAVAEAYAAHCLDVYDHYAWRYWLSTQNEKAWHFLATDDSWQDSYFTSDNQVKSAELNFWLGASPSTEALPTPNVDASTRARPALQAETGGLSPAVVRIRRPTRGRQSRPRREREAIAASPIRLRVNGDGNSLRPSRQVGDFRPRDG